MGLDTTHGAFHGGYGSFMQWRIWLAQQIGIPLDLMEGFYYKDQMNDPFVVLKGRVGKDDWALSGVKRLEECLPLKWSAFKPDPIHQLLYHSDCDGYLNWKACGKIAKRLREVLEKVKDDTDPNAPKRGIYDGMYPCTMRFIEGLELAFKNKEKLGFH